MSDIRKLWEDCHVVLEGRNNVVSLDVSKNRIKVIPSVVTRLVMWNIIGTDAVSVALIECCFAKRHTTRGIDSKSINTGTSEANGGLIRKPVKRQTLCRTTCLQFD